MDKNASVKADKTPQTSPNLPSLRSFNWTGSPPFHRSFVLQGLLQSPGSGRRLGSLTESQSYRPSPLC